MARKVPKPVRKHITEAQKEALICFMEKNGDLASSAFTTPQAREVKKVLLEQLTEELNSLPNGVQRSPKDWMKCWTENKSKSKGKAVAIMRHISDADPLTEIPPLTSWEERIVALIPAETISNRSVVSEISQITNPVNSPPSVPSSSPHESKYEERYIEPHSETEPSIEAAIDMLGEKVCAGLQAIAASQNEIAASNKAISKSILALAEALTKK